MIPFHVVKKAALRTATSASSSLSLSRTAPPSFHFHTSSTLGVESARKRQARLTRQKNLAKREELLKKAAAARPHVVLGTVYARDKNAGEDKWATCDLAKVLVSPEELAPDAPVQRISLPSSSMAEGEEVPSPSLSPSLAAEVQVPEGLAFGIRERERRMLFEHLPLLSADMRTRGEMMNSSWSSGSLKKAEEMTKRHESEMSAGAAQANVLAKLVDLRNANAAGIAFEDRRRVIAAFSEPGKPNDTGRTEVQAALLTLQIRNVWNHLSQFRRDVANRRSLRRLVHQRAKLLKYLKCTDRDRYERVLERLGLEPGAVEGELVV